MKTEKITLETRDGPMDLHVYHPSYASNKPVPAIMVLQEAFGVNANIREICQKFAQDGYLAVAPELFHRVGKGIDVPYSNIPEIMKILGSLLTDELAEDLQVTYQYLKNQKDHALGAIGSIGFCMGGFTSILGSCRLSLDFAISCYGGGISNHRPGIGFTPIIEEFNRIHCPVFLLYGEKDQSIPLDQVETVRGHLKRFQKEYEIKVYRGAGHAFLRKGEQPYHPDAATEAWKDIEAWLKPLVARD